MDRPLSAGFDLYKTITYFQQASYQGDQTAAGIRFGFPTSEFGSVGLRYTFSVNQITPFAGAPTVILAAQGTATTSSIGYSYSYNTLDDPIKPRHGLTFQFNQDFAGFGGNVKFIRTETAFAWHHPVFWDEMVATVQMNSGYIQGYGGKDILLEDRFFKGGDSFPGFALAGIGPREISATQGENAVGGDAYAIASAQLRLPDFLPSDYGVGLSLFTDVGTLGHLDTGTEGSNCAIPGDTCIKDNMGIRATGGLGIGKYLSVELIRYIRPEAKFADLAALVAQIRADAGKAREILAKTP